MDLCLKYAKNLLAELQFMITCASISQIWHKNTYYWAFVLKEMKIIKLQSHQPDYSAGIQWFSS